MNLPHNQYLLVSRFLHKQYHAALQYQGHKSLIALVFPDAQCTKMQQLLPQK
jgi:hypothetical protein